ncbi:choice-of-anchor D domain-containing protein [Actinospica sp. MGRD01-02]|uniref:Choice-of-anchor D domain-containing protein n=1 Tax=Actinospica acidithermotolerans TaxID=2828514 RepID=A0A941E8Z2_9ACTN|nr:choice-of-anchor D domain-containing protein [Actinospica acidithermotolerans]MBR7826113.1 choice-of-anchor D domain-containing protein [Actinospica acidithermotolerans]
MRSALPRTGSTRIRVLILSLLVGMTAATLSVASAHADVVTVSNDNQRTGWDQNEASLTSGSVTGSDFGELFSTAVVGQVYAQPLVVGTTVIVGTEENHVYGINSETGAIEWQDYLGPSWPASTIGCGDLVPDIGITSTPVYDASTGYVYLTAKVNDGANATVPHYYLYAMSATTGAIRTGWPVSIAGSPSNDTAVSFNPERELQRPGILFQNGSVYMAFGGHCDYGPYRGYVVGVNASTKSLHMWTDEAGSNASGAGIWQSGGGIVTDGSSGMYIATGNGVTPPVGVGTSPPKDLSESVVHLNVASDGTISASDFFSPANASTLDANDQDVSSGGPAALPDAEFGTSTYPHLMVQIGKDGRLWLLNRASLGGRAQGSGGTDAVVGQTQLSGVWGHPAVWGGDGGYVYVSESNSHLVALAYGLTGSGVPSFRVAGTSQQTFPFSSGSPVVTSNGTTSGSALVWVIQSSGSTGTNGQLMVYNAVPSSGVMTLLRSWPLGTVTKFSVPATNNGRVYVGTRDGHLLGFGAPTTATLQGASTGFGNVAVGSTGTTTATLTATRDVTITGVSANAPFSAGTTTPSLPTSLTAGQTLTVPVTFSPTTWGADTSELTVTTDVGNFEFGLNGTGTQAGLGATPTSLAWGTRAVGSSETLTVGVTNTGTSTETFSSVTGPNAPFTASGLPAVGSTLAPGATTTISATYAPTAVAASDSSSIVLTSDQGSLTIPLTGSAIAADPQVTISPTSLSFGNVVAGKTATQTFTVSNTGNVNLTVTKAAPPTAPFAATNPIPEGQQLAPGETYTVTMTFTPTAAQSYSGAYEVSTDTGQGAMYVNVTGTGVPASGQLFSALRSSTGTWSAWTQGPANSSGIAQTAVTAMPDGDSQAVAVTTSGTVEHTVYSSSAGTWQNWGVPKNNTTAVSASIAGMPDGSSQLIEVTKTGTLEHDVRYANGTWQASSWGVPAGSTGIAEASITAMPNGSSQLVAVTTSGVLEHNIRNANGSWQGWRALTQTGVKVTYASIAGMPDGSSQIVEVTSTGVLKHDIRLANGSWQSSGWGVPAGSTGIAEATITAMPNGSSQIIAVTTSGVLKHDIRNANGSWQAGNWDAPTQTTLATKFTSPTIAGLTSGVAQILEVSAG